MSERTSETTSETTSEPVVTYDTHGSTAVVTMNRPQYRNAQNSAMTYALDAAFYRAADDDESRSSCWPERETLLRRPRHRHPRPGRGPVQYDRTRRALVGPRRQARARKAVTRGDRGLPGHVPPVARLPKPTVAMVQGACIAGGLMLAWGCDLVVAADDAFFADPVVKMGIPGVEYFAHPS